MTPGHFYITHARCKGRPCYALVRVEPNRERAWLFDQPEQAWEARGVFVLFGYPLPEVHGTQ